MPKSSTKTPAPERKPCEICGWGFAIVDMATTIQKLNGDEWLVRYYCHGCWKLRNGTCIPRKEPEWMKKEQANGLSGCCRVSCHHIGDGTFGCDKCGQRSGQLWKEPTPATRYSHGETERKDDAQAVREMLEIRDFDPISRPKHYASQVPGIECYQVTQWFPGNRANIIKYAWRCGEKGDPIADLRKIIRYAEFEIERIQNASPVQESHLCTCGLHGLHVCRPPSLHGPTPPPALG